MLIFIDSHYPGTMQGLGAEPALGTNDCQQVFPAGSGAMGTLGKQSSGAKREAEVSRGGGTGHHLAEILLL